MRDWPRGTGGKVTMHHLRLPKEVVSSIDGIVVNDEEFVYSRDTVEQIGRNGYGVVTIGVNGARLYSPRGQIESPGFDVPIVDLTGAGDTFTAAFFYRITDPNVSPVSALEFANAAAGLSLGGIGASAVPSRAAIKRLVDQVASER
jgi:sugar/nucleoside kinase (ribokinase family)